MTEESSSGWIVWPFCENTFESILDRNSIVFPMSNFDHFTADPWQQHFIQVYWSIDKTPKSRCLHLQLIYFWASWDWYFDLRSPWSSWHPATCTSWCPCICVIASFQNQTERSSKCLYCCCIVLTSTHLCEYQFEIYSRLRIFCAQVWIKIDPGISPGNWTEICSSPFGTISLLSCCDFCFSLFHLYRWLDLRFWHATTKHVMHSSSYFLILTWV